MITEEFDACAGTTEVDLWEFINQLNRIGFIFQVDNYSWEKK
jgi:hypothetical protein